MTRLHHLTPDFQDMFKRHPYSPQMSHTQIDLEDVCYKKSQMFEGHPQGIIFSA
jgi:hypothetical protein